MVRNYSRKTKKYTEEDVTNALEKILKDKQSVYNVAKSSGIPKASLYHFIKLHKAKKKTFLRKMGRQPALNENEELNIVKVCAAAGELGWPVDRNDVADIISKYCIRMKRKTQFKDNYPSKDFMIKFFKRHKDKVNIRRASTLKVVRAQAEHPAIISEFALFLISDTHTGSLMIFKFPSNDISCSMFTNFSFKPV